MGGDMYIKRSRTQKLMPFYLYSDECREKATCLCSYPIAFTQEGHVSHPTECGKPAIGSWGEDGTSPLCAEHFVKAFCMLTGTTDLFVQQYTKEFEK